MQHIDCPWCGLRPQTEFSYHRVVEGIPRAWPEDQSAHIERLIRRGNQIGVQEELWQHQGGCRGWIIVQRHNLTHEIAGMRAVPAQ